MNKDSKVNNDNKVNNEEYDSGSAGSVSSSSRIGNSNENKEQKVEEIQRITVSKQGQDALTAIVEKVNDGFIGGKINRTQAANWILMRFNKNLSEADIKEIRTEYFDEVAMLELIFRKAKESGKVPNEFKVLLQKQIESNETVKKRPKKFLTEQNINDVINNNVK